MDTNKIVYETTETTELIRAYWRKSTKKYYDTHKAEITRKARERAASARLPSPPFSIKYEYFIGKVCIWLQRSLLEVNKH